MKGTVKLALALAACAALPVATMAPPAAARGVNVTVSPAIAFGYSDGYWDRDHHWHPWQNRREAEAWQREHPTHYYNHRHDRDRDAGWHDNDRWWAHHR